MKHPPLSFPDSLQSSMHCCFRHFFRNECQFQCYLIMIRFAIDDKVVCACLIENERAELFLSQIRRSLLNRKPLSFTFLKKGRVYLSNSKDNENTTTEESQTVNLYNKEKNI
eukprot:GDKK01018161.1.p1 GENE.GDKK01018161.1~~GDKK01018161.1.p1  ORF type:complete len:112 (-),score=5.64 GDKK01018161.1:481-816(-)